MKMGVHNLPSIFINGELKFSSLIPEQASCWSTRFARLFPGTVRR